MSTSAKMPQTAAEWRALAKQTRREASGIFMAGDEGDHSSDMLAFAADCERIAKAIEAIVIRR